MAITVGSLASILTTEFNSLANAAYTVASSAYANRTNLNMYADFELVATFGVAPTLNNTVDIYIIPSVDAANYADGSNTVVPPATYFRGGFPLRAVTTAQRIALMGVPLPPDDFKVIAYNGSGQAMAATSNTLKMSPYKIG